LNKKIYVKIFILTVLLVPFFVDAARVDELESQIEEKNKKIKEIQEDINKYQKELTGIRDEKQTLENVINELDASRRKVNASINLTQSEIDNAILNIERLNIEINERGREINLNTDAVGEIIRRIYENESQSFAEVILGYSDLSEFWNDLDSLEQFQSVVREDLQELHKLREELESTKRQLQGKEHELSQLRVGLFGQREVIDQNKEEKDQLLDVTENEESKYQALLAERIRQRQIFEKELNAIEEELRIAVDPSSIPSTRSGVLAWPLNNVLITQHFGNTAFATANAQVYNGNGHNGIDLAASTGTGIKAALSGTVMGTGNTDLQAGCYSYGKWVLLKHNNGLSTLYAHLSVISVNSGQSVKTGDILGFSGNTGYSTGPHLHFSVFASEGVQVVRLGDVKSVTNCGNMKIPIAPKEAYLNPLSYL